MRDAVRAFLLAAPAQHGPKPNEPKGMIDRATVGLSPLSGVDEPDAIDRVITMLRVLLPVLEECGIRPRRGRPSKVAKELRADVTKLEAMRADSQTPGGPSMRAQARQQVQRRRTETGKNLAQLGREARAVVEGYRRLLKKRSRSMNR